MFVIRDPYTSKGNVIFDMYRFSGGQVNDFDCLKAIEFSVV
jgi:predicted phage gp36 major capsid-like protein